MDLDAALRGGDWATALAGALERWRAGREPEVADLIDAIAARLPGLVAPRQRLHAWWMQHATPYDPTAVASLVAHASARIAAMEGDVAALQERVRGAAAGFLARFIAEVPRLYNESSLDRLAAILTWPDDPRAATILTSWLVTAPVRWDPLDHGRATFVYYDAIAERLTELADARTLSDLVACVATPRGPTRQLRQHQQALARQLIVAIEARERPTPTAIELAYWRSLGTRDAVTPPAHLDALWAEVARSCDELEPRRVLADALIERHDPRGEVIALQCAGAAAAARASALIRTHWNAFLGDLALILNRKGTTFQHGMLHQVRVGTPRSPEWAFTKVHGHRELACVQIVRPGHVRPAHYADFLCSPNLAPDLVELDAPEIVDELAARRPRWAFRALAYGHQSVRDHYRNQFRPLAMTFAALAPLVPDLEELELDDERHPEITTQLVELAPGLRSQFPGLRRIALRTRDTAQHSRLSSLGIELV